MREVIQKIIEVEQQAKGVLEAAQTEAERIRVAAHGEARRITDDARRDGQAEAQGIVEAAEREAEEEKARRLAVAAARIEAQVKLAAAVRRRAVERIVRRICGDG
jgi:vacuolar-type H+-ATPase subunit H